MVRVSVDEAVHLKGNIILKGNQYQWKQRALCL